MVGCHEGAATLGNANKHMVNGKFLLTNIDNKGQNFWPNPMAIFTEIAFNTKNKNSLIELPRDRFDVNKKTVPFYDEKAHKWDAFVNDLDKYDFPRFL